MATLTIDKSKIWTAQDYLQLGESNMPSQLVNGELIMSPAPNPQHQRLSGRLFRMIDKHVGKNGELFYAPIDLYIDQQNVFQPDLVYISEEKYDIITERGIEGVPTLVIEIISPSNSYIDRNRKKKKYLEFGVSEFWIVDPGNKTLEIYTPQTGPDSPLYYLAEEGEVTSGIFPGMKLKISDLF